MKTQFQELGALAFLVDKRNMGFKGSIRDGHHIRWFKNAALDGVRPSEVYAFEVTTGVLEAGSAVGPVDSVKEDVKTPRIGVVTVRRVCEPNRGGLRVD